MNEGIFDTSKAAKLDTPGRVRELRPPVLLKEVGGVREGFTCVDFGSGTGVFALPMAELVGKTGRVYAVDNSDAMMESIRAKNPPPNLELVRADVGRTGLPDAIADFCLLAFILHEVSEPAGLVVEAARLLRPGGRMVVVDWRAEQDSPGPPRRKRISKEMVEGFFGQAGIAFRKYLEWDPLHYAASGDKPMDNERVKRIEEAIADLKARWPAHSVPPRMWQELEDLEEQLERAKEAAGRP